MSRTNWAAVAVVALSAVGTGGAGEPAHRPRSGPAHTHARAGYPQELSPLAHPGRTPRYGGGYVGGGRLALFFRTPDGRDVVHDGTWGWDYVGVAGRRPGHVFLDWWHDRPRQPMPGPYRTDGPHVPDVVALHPLRRLLHPEEHDVSGEK